MATTLDCRLNYNRYFFTFYIRDNMLFFLFIIKVIELLYLLIFPSFAKLNIIFITLNNLAPLLVCPILARICPLVA
jgi:hypothetical protein